MLKLSFPLSFHLSFSSSHENRAVTLCKKERVGAKTGQLANAGLMGLDEDKHKHISSTVFTQDDHICDPSLKSRGLGTIVPFYN